MQGNLPLLKICILWKNGSKVFSYETRWKCVGVTIHGCTSSPFSDASSSYMCPDKTNRGSLYSYLWHSYSLRILFLPRVSFFVRIFKHTTKWHLKLEKIHCICIKDKMKHHINAMIEHWNTEHGNYIFMLSVPTGRIEKSFRTEECCDFDGLTQIRKVN